jgi:hypothetical protein
VLRVQANAEQQKAAGEFYAQNGDCFLAWVNEGDFLNVTLPRPTPDLGDVDELVERLKAHAANLDAEGLEGFAGACGEAADAIIALRAALDKKD